MPGMDAATLAQVAACEQRLVNLWPAEATMLIGDWVVRFANGYSGRANSASPLKPGSGLSDADIALIVGLYRDAGLAPAIRLTPLAEPGIEARLIAAGWQVRTRSNGMVRPATGSWRPDTAVTLASTPPPHWLDGISALQEPSKRDPAHLQAIVGRIRLPTAFATLAEAGAPCAYGMAATDRGWTEIGSIMVHPAARGKGMGRRLVTALLHWAGRQGAQAGGGPAGSGHVFLQVERANAPAIALYRALGFADLYTYVEYRLPQDGVRPD